MLKGFGKKIKSERGQGLMELIVAIGIIVVGLFSVWALFFSNFAGEQEAETRMVASNLSREGLEAVKNLRDSNWLSIENNVLNSSGNLWAWDQGFVDPGYYALDQIFSTSSSYVGSTTLTSITGPSDAKAIIYIDKNGFYDHNNTGRPSGFSRFLVMKNICCQSADGFKCDDTAFALKDTVCSLSGDEIKIGVDVVSEVRWQASNKQARSVSLEDQLFNWK